MPDITKLAAQIRAAIAGATPGEWYIGKSYTDDEGYVEIPIQADIGGKVATPAAVCLQFPRVPGMQDANARLIALANPANLTALLDALDALMVDAERWRWIKPEDEMPHEHELVLVTIRFASGELHRCLAAYATDQSSGLLKWWDDDGSPIYNNVIRWARLPDAAIDAARRRG